MMTEKFFSRLCLTFAIFGCSVFLLTISNHAFAQSGSSYYVATTGNNKNPGTESKPWRTIQHAASSPRVKPGDTVFIRAGTYRENITQKRTGAPGRPITYQNYPGETPVISSGPGAAGLWRWRITDKSYLRFRGLTFRDYEGGAIYVSAKTKNITDVGISDSVFRNQKKRNAKSAKVIKIKTDEPNRTITNVVINNNTFENIDNGTEPGSANETITLSGAVRYAKITGNLLNAITNIGIDLIGLSDKGRQPENILIRGNRVIRCGTAPKKTSNCIYLDNAGKNIIVEYNTVVDSPRGIHVNLEPRNRRLVTERVIIRNNLLYNNQYNLDMGTGGANKNCATVGVVRHVVAVHNTIVNGERNNYFNCGTHLRWKNNLFAQTRSGKSIQHEFPNPTANGLTATWVLDHNLYYDKGGRVIYRWKQQTLHSLPEFQAASGQDRNSITANPQFVDVQKRNFRLQSHSPARNSAGPLTKTINRGSGTHIAVADASYFTNGFGLQQGDLIRIGQHAAVRVMQVDYQSNTLVVDRAITWKKGDPLNYAYDDNGPDFGASFSEPASSNLLPVPHNLHVVQ